MAKDKPRGSTPSWKDNVKPQVDRKQSSQPEWRREPAPTAGIPRSRLTRRTKLAIGFGAFAGIVGGIIALIYLIWPPKPSAVVLIGAGYETNLSVPHNAYGWDGLNDYNQVADTSNKGFLWWKSGLLHLRQGPKLLKRGEPWDQALDTPFNEQTIIVVFNMQGGADSQGAYLMRDDADARVPKSSEPIHTQSRLRMDAVIDRLKSLPENKNKVLIVDATQATDDWQYGMLHNDFARELRKLEDKVKGVPNLVVLCSSDVDQRSWVSEERRRTIFHYYVLQGLKGLADKDGNRTVTALELHEYVHDKVERWVRDNRKELQTPFLLGGEERARNIGLIVVDNVPGEPEPERAPELPKELDTAWQKYNDLQNQSPAPAVYAPHVWRRYTDSLLRMEELYRAGDAKNAGNLKSDLAHLEGKMQQARRLRLDSTPFTLPLAAAAGMESPLPKSELDSKFTTLWNAAPAERNARWKEVQAGIPEGSKSLVLGQLADLLVQKAINNPARDLDKAVELLPLIYVSGNERPTEVHFLRMLKRDLPADSPPAPDLLTLALETHRLAEQTTFAIQPDQHPYSEQVYPWIAERIKKADALRRTGEDRLFDPKVHGKARQDLVEARAEYQSAAKDATVVRNALNTRDLVVATLPSYSRWLARRQRAANSDWEPVVDLWAKAHQLTQLLESPDPAIIDKPPANDPKALSLKGLSGSVRDDFVKLEDTFREYAKSLLSFELQHVSRDIDDALAVPRLDPGLRKDLLNHAREVSYAFLTGTSQKGSVAEGVTPEENEKALRDQAHRQGQLCLAVLGERWVNEIPKDESWRTYNEVRQELRGVRTDDKNWPTNLARAGEEMSHRWVRLPQEIGRLTESSAKSSLKVAADDLTKAERLVRLIDGAGANSVDPNPVSERGKVLWHNLLLAQARRTRTDFWAAEQGNAEAYYKTASFAYLRDAERLIRPGAGDSGTSPTERTVLVKEVKEEIAQAAGFKPVLKRPVRPPYIAANVVHLTSERQIDLGYTIDADASVPDGYPAFWIELGKFLNPAGPDKDKIRPTTYEIAGKQRQVTVGGTVENQLMLDENAKLPDVPEIRTSTASLRGLFRGHQIKVDTQVLLHPLADLSSYDQPPPPNASIAVRATDSVHAEFGASSGSIVIILDCSGSMGENKPGTRFWEATQALGKVLQRIPEGAKVSLWVYAQKEKEDAKNQGVNVHQTIKPLVQGEKWSAAKQKNVMAQVAKLEPWNFTPVVRAMMEARVDLDKAAGFKTMIVLTDGMDTQFEPGTYDGQRMPGDPKYNPDGSRKIPEFITEKFKDSGIQINIVGFQISEKEEKQAKDQFEKAVKKLPVPGNFFLAKNLEQLIDSLTKALRQRLRYSIEDQFGNPVSGISEEGLDVVRVGAQYEWFLVSPGTYRVWVQTNRRIEQRVEVEKGQLLLIDLYKESEQLRFRRAVFADDYLPKPRLPTKDNWLLAALQNQLKPSGAQQMMVSLERLIDRGPEGGGTIRQVRPLFTWMELHTAEPSSAPYAMRWGYLPGIPSPSWNLDVARWPSRPGSDEPAKPLLKAWWSRGQAPGASAFREFAGSPLQTKDVKMIVDDKDEILLESVSIEDHVVATTPDGKPEKVSCMVVRLSYPPGRPVYAQVSPASAGHEHRFYSKAGKYTGIYWPINKSQAEEIKVLNVFSLERFKNAESTSKAELPLPSPVAGDDRPYNPPKDFFQPVNRP